jgi:hypothetical protein
MASLMNKCIKVVAHNYSNNHVDLDQLPPKLKSFLTCCNKDNINFDDIATLGHLNCLDYAMDIQQWDPVVATCFAKTGNIEGLKHISGLQWDMEAALCMACDKDQFECAKYLIEIGAPIQNFIEIAIHKDNVNYIRYLIEKRYCSWNEEIYDNIISFDALQCFKYMEQEYPISTNSIKDIIAYDSINILHYKHLTGNLIDYNNYDEYIEEACNSSSIKCIIYCIKNNLFNVNDVADQALVFDNAYILFSIIKSVPFQITDEFVYSIANVERGAFSCMCYVYDMLNSNQKMILKYEAIENDLKNFLYFLYGNI